MHRIPVLIFLTLFFFILEFVLFNAIHPLIVPNFLILLIVFLTFSFGVRYSLFVALLGGLLKDSFQPDLFGLNMLSYVLSAYVAVFVKKNFTHFSPQASRPLMVTILIVFVFSLQYIIRFMFGPVDLLNAFLFILLPQLIMTLAVASFTFKKIKSCVSKFYV